MRKYLLENKKNLIIYIIICFFAAILSAGTAFLYQKLTFFAVSKEFKKLIFLGFIAIPYLTIEAMFDYFPRKFKSKIINNIIKKLREDLIIKIDREDISYLNLDYKKDLKNKMINDLEAINNYFNGILSSLLYVFMFFISLLSAIYIQGTLTFIMLLLSFIPFLSPFISRKILSNKKEEELDSKSAYLENFDEFSENILFIKISKLGSYFNNKLGELADILKDKSILFESSLAKTFAISYGLGNILYSGAWIIGGFFVYKNLIDLPSLIAMTTLMVTIAGPIQSIADSYSGIISSKKIFDKYLEYLEETNIDKGTVEIGKIDKLVFDNIDLKFANNYIIKNINLEIKSANKYLILGDSGSGKSSFLNLILGMFANENKKIFINGYALSQLNKKSYYENIYFIPQDTIIFTGSIIDNITLFDEDKNYDRCLKILDMVGLNYLIKNRNLNYKIDKTTLSGGEKKRIDLARAIYSDKSMIIIDEVTSGLDTYNENLVAQIIKEIENKIIICVSHSTNPNLLDSFNRKLKIENKKIYQF